MNGRIRQNGGVKKLPFPRIGTLHIGEKRISPKTGKEYPVSLDFFKAQGKYAELFHKAYGEKPSTIQVIFPSNDASQCCEERYEYRDDYGKLMAYGDGETYWYYNGTKYTEISAEAYPNFMEQYAKKYPSKQGWKITLTMQVICPLIKGVAGVWQFTTKGTASSIPNIRDVFDMMLESNGNVAGVVFDLNVQYATSNKPNDTSRYPVVSLVPNESDGNMQRVKASYALAEHIDK